MRKILAFVIAALMALAVDDAAAQTYPTPPGYSQLGGFAALAVTSTSARVKLPVSTVGFPAITIVNYGDKDVFLKFGDITVTAATTNIPLRAGKHITLFAAQATYLAAICGGSDTSSLDVYQGNGPIAYGP